MATRRQSGFTLLEALLAVFLTSIVMLTVGTTFIALLDARDLVDDLAESTEAGPRIINLIERDLQGIWTHNVGNNAVFRGRDMDVAGKEADRIDFLTTTDAVSYVLDLQNTPRKPSICEVGYWFKPNLRFRDCFEMWRREDPMVDDDLLTQGSFQLVHDRIKSFKVSYYRTLGVDAIEELEWDSAVEDALPARMKIEFTIERKRSSRNVVSDVEIDDFEGAEKTYVRHIVFDERVRSSVANGTARIPVFPGKPQSEGDGAGENGPKGPAGPGGVKPGDGGLAAGGRPGADVQAGQRPGGSRPGGAARPGVPGGLPPGFNPGQFLNGLGGQGGGLGGLFGGGGGRQ